MLNLSCRPIFFSMIVLTLMLSGCFGHGRSGRRGCDDCQATQFCTITPQHGETLTYGCEDIPAGCRDQENHCECIQQAASLEHYQCSQSHEGSITLLCCQSVSSEE